jgi:hypothetical protein
MDALQYDSQKYWQCQDDQVTNYVASYDGTTDETTYDTTLWWTTCYSTYSCLVWDALPTLNITIGAPDAPNELMMTTYSFLNPLTPRLGNNSAPYLVDNTNNEVSTSSSEFRCQLMFSFNSTNYNQSNITMG